jgi:hypothetical protein
MDHNVLYDIAQNSVFFVQNGDVLRIDYTQDDGFHCHEELTGLEYFVEFDIVNPKQDFFYRLERVNLKN